REERRREARLLRRGPLGSHRRRPRRRRPDGVHGPRAHADRVSRRARVGRRARAAGRFLSPTGAAPATAGATDRPPAIVLLITELAYGGTPRTVQRLAVGLARRGHRVHVASLFAAAGITGELGTAGIPVVGFGIERRGLAPAVRDLARFLRATRPGVLHMFNFHANLLGRVVGAALGVPGIVASERTVESGKARWRVWCDRLSWRLAHRWMVNA